MHNHPLKSPILHIVLYQPEIPPNTGNVIRLCANMGCHLHLIEPLGFDMSDKHMRRAGLDYHEWASLAVHPNFDTFIATVKPSRVMACETSGAQYYTDISFHSNDAIVFGCETRGLPRDFLATMNKNQIFHIPMRPNIRSLNLSNAVAVVAYEVWRQWGFVGGE